jgi:hypothetical protein
MLTHCARERLVCLVQLAGAVEETMRRDIVVLLATILLATIIPSCTEGPLEGDWFACVDAACTVLDENGIRFTADGRWGILEAPGSELEPGETYELGGARGTYRYGGSTLTLTLDGTTESETVQVSFDGELLVIHVKTTIVSCANTAPPPGGGEPPPPICEESVEEDVVRLKRVGPAGEVPEGEGPRWTDDIPAPPPQAPTPAP